jgi:hypothetical protein
MQSVSSSLQDRLLLFMTKPLERGVSLRLLFFIYLYVFGSILLFVTGTVCSLLCFSRHPAALLILILLLAK